MKLNSLWFFYLAAITAACHSSSPTVTPVTPADSTAKTARQAQTWLLKPSQWQLTQMWFGSNINPTRVLIYQRGQPLQPGTTAPSLDWMRLKDNNTAQFKYTWNTKADEFLYKVDDVANNLILYQTNIFNPSTLVETWYIQPKAVHSATFDMTLTSPGDSYTLTFTAVP